MRVIYLLSIALFLFSVGCEHPQNVSIAQMKACKDASDCIPVECSCKCSSSNGFSYDDVVNKKYENPWYSQHKCSRPQMCPEVECPSVKVICKENRCGVK